MTIEDLRKGKRLYLLLCTYEDELRELHLLSRTLPTSLGNPRVGSYPHSNKSTIEEITIEIMEQEEKIVKTIQKYIEEKEKISNAIESLTDLTEKTILRMKYVNRMSMKDIGKSTGYVRSYLYEIHDRAVKKLEKMG